MIKNLYHLIVLLFLVGCASSGQKTIMELRHTVLLKEYDKALEFLSSNSFYNRKENNLLKLIETGTIKHLKGDYYTSLKIFDQAKELSDRLFTVSISKKIISAVATDSDDNYYGERYERSLIMFYLVLNHYMLYRTGTYEEHYLDSKKENKVPEKKLTDKERKFHLSASRANVLAWDSILENYRGTRGGKSVYKDDLTAKIFGAFIHEEMGTSSDLRIAKDLYKKAKEVLFRNYNTYPTFNDKSKEFRDNFEKFSKMSEKKVEAQYVLKTTFYNQLTKFLDERIQMLSKKKKSNLKILLQNGFISEKSKKEFHFPIPFAAVAVLSGKMAMAFTANILSTAPGMKPSISFELPEILPKKTVNTTILVAKNSKGEVKKATVTVIDPLSDIAYEAMDESITATYAKIGARVAMKHATALVTAYLSYQGSVKAGMNKMLAEMAAGVTYSAANKAIRETEKADLRSWVTLPHDLRMGEMNLKKGNYELSIEKIDSNNNATTIPIGNVSINDKKDTHFINLRI